MRILALLALLVLAPVPLVAQGFGSAQLPLSVRAFSLGGAFPLNDRDPDLLFGNPALVERARGSSLGLHSYTADERYASMSASTGWFGGGAALGLRHGERGVGEARRTTETALTAGYGRTLWGVRLGAALTGVEIRGGVDSDVTAFLDLGAAFDAGPVTVGVSGGGFGGTLDVPGADLPHPLWGRVAMGSRAAPIGPLDIGGAATVTVREGGEVEAGGGLEVGWWPVQGRTLVGRMGVGGPDLDGASWWTLGAAFLGDSFTLEYGWRPRTDARGIHVVGVRFR